MGECLAVCLSCLLFFSDPLLVNSFVRTASHDILMVGLLVDPPLLLWQWVPSPVEVHLPSGLDRLLVPPRDDEGVEDGPRILGRERGHVGLDHVAKDNDEEGQK